MFNEITETDTVDIYLIMITIPQLDDMICRGIDVMPVRFSIPSIDPGHIIHLPKKIDKKSQLRNQNP